MAYQGSGFIIGFSFNFVFTVAALLSGTFGGGSCKLRWTTMKLFWVPFLMVGLSYPKLTESASTQPSCAKDQSGEGSHYCYGEIGCVAINQEFYHPVHRSINFAPETREEIKVIFKIRSQEDPVGVAVPGLDVQQARKSTFKPSRKTKIIIHGFMSSKEASSMKEISDAFVRHYDVNVVSVDWSEGAYALYAQAVANTRVVGLEVAHFINWLRDNMGLNVEDVHLIGHSLGAHTCGYAGERIPGLGRITGLDPAEPYFEKLPESVRLDPSDATLVDVIHTDSKSIFRLGFGTDRPSGHLDFYPNDGNKQQGCKELLPALISPKLLTGSGLSDVWRAVKDTFGCNHRRAAELFADSIRSSCPYIAFQCKSYKEYKAGKCVSCGDDGSNCAPMGLHADTWPGVGSGRRELPLYLSTGYEPQFCKYHYQVDVQLGDLPDTTGSETGSLSIAFLTKDGRQIKFDLTSGRAKTFSSRSRYNFFLEDNDNVDDSTEMTVTWVTSKKTSLTLAGISVLNIDTYFSRNLHSRSGTTISFCAEMSQPLSINNNEAVKVKASTNCYNFTLATTSHTEL